MAYNKKLQYLIISSVLLVVLQLSLAQPILGGQIDVEDNAKVQGKIKPIYVFCDAIGNHLNCILYCKSMAFSSGTCGSDSFCNCF